MVSCLSSLSNGSDLLLELSRTEDKLWPLPYIELAWGMIAGGPCTQVPRTDNPTSALLVSAWGASWPSGPRPFT